MEKLKNQLATKDKELQSAVHLSLERSEQVKALEKANAHQLEVEGQQQIEHQSKVKQLESINSQLEAQLSQAIMESKRHERELFALQELVKEKVQTIAELRGLETSYQEAVRKNDELAAEINHLQKKSESQTRDLKKTMKDNAQALAEFEKALIRKSEECNDLYFKINAMKDAENERLAVEQANGGSRSLLAATQFLSAALTSNNSAPAESSAGEAGTGDGSNATSAGQASGGSTLAGLRESGGSLLRRLSLSASSALSSTSSTHGSSTTTATTADNYGSGRYSSQQQTGTGSDLNL